MRSLKAAQPTSPLFDELVWATKRWWIPIAAQGLCGANDDWLIGNAWVGGKAELKNRAATHIGLC